MGDTQDNGDVLHEHDHPRTWLPNDGRTVIGHKSGIVLVRAKHRKEHSAWTRKVRKEKAYRIFPGCFIGTGLWESAKPWEQYRLLCLASALHYPDRFLELEAAASVLGISLPTSPRRIDLGSASSRTHEFRVTGIANVKVHRRHRSVPPGEVILHQGIAVTSPAWTAMAIVNNCREEDGLKKPLMVIEGALRLGVTKEEMRTCLDKSRGRMGGAFLDKCLRLASARSDSAAESFMSAILHEAGIEFVQQAELLRDIDGGFNKVARVDFLLPDLAIVIEVDGKGKYGANNRDQRLSVLDEREREKDITNLRYRVLRFEWSDLENGSALRLIRAEIQVASRNPTTAHGHWERAELDMHVDAHGNRIRAWYR